MTERSAPGERVVAVVPFAAVPKVPGRVKRRDKVRIGVRQSWRRYRPLVFTDRRLYVFDSGRTPHPRELLASFPVAEVGVHDVRAGSFGGREVVLDLPGTGAVPFEIGRKDLDDLVHALHLLGVRTDT
ncbi:MAG: hypothetical protein U0W40_06645 [Acidimicrobiia bacterium]